MEGPITSHPWPWSVAPKTTKAREAPDYFWTRPQWEIPGRLRVWGSGHAGSLCGGATGLWLLPWPELIPSGEPAGLGAPRQIKLQASVSSCEPLSWASWKSLRTRGRERLIPAVSRMLWVRQGRRMWAPGPEEGLGDLWPASDMHVSPNITFSVTCLQCCRDAVTPGLSCCCRKRLCWPGTHSCLGHI